MVCIELNKCTNNLVFVKVIVNNKENSASPVKSALLPYFVSG